MCIRDRCHGNLADGSAHRRCRCATGIEFRGTRHHARPWFCLLYTSDAADERSSVDLGGRRIIKKKKKQVIGGGQTR